jgi:hypothetical protein
VGCGVRSRGLLVVVACLRVIVRGCVLVLCGVCCVHREPGRRRLLSCCCCCVGGVVVGVGLVVCVTSCEGHMVDALASRADEGRRSLR